MVWSEWYLSFIVSCICIWLIHFYEKMWSDIYIYIYIVQTTFVISQSNQFYVCSILKFLRLDEDLSSNRGGV